MNKRKLLQMIERVEKAHFRTVEDTGAHPCARLIWNIVRQEAGLPPLELSDLHSYCERCGSYHHQGKHHENSIPQTNVAGV